MAIIDTSEHQVTLKLVYCGPPGSGKSTNLSQLHDLVDQAHRGRLLALGGTGGQRHFVDLLPIFFQVGGLRICLKVYTVPGQAEHQMTRRAVLRGADGIVFVADSDPERNAHNAWAHGEILENLRTIEVEPQIVLLTTQYNKRDLCPGDGPEPFATETVVPASAHDGTGVLETFLALAEQAWRSAELGSEEAAALSVSPEDFTKALTSHFRNVM